MQQQQTHTDAIYNSYVTRISDEKCFIKPCGVIKNLHVPQDGVSVKPRIDLPPKPIVFNLAAKGLQGKVNVRDYLHIEIYRNKSDVTNKFFYKLKKIHKVVPSFQFEKDTDDNVKVIKEKTDVVQKVEQKNKSRFADLAWESDSDDE